MRGISRRQAALGVGIVSIVDPLFTVPLLALVGVAAVRRSRRYVIGALLWGADAGSDGCSALQIVPRIVRFSPYISAKSARICAARLTA